MSRFTPSRRNQILAWTGASLAWGTVFVAAKAEPQRAQEAKADSAAAEATVTTAAIPQLPPSGLTIIRYTPTLAPEPEILTVYVQAATPGLSSQRATSAAPAASAAAPAAPAPAPASSGS